MSYFLFLLISLSTAYAGLERMKVSGLNLNYIYPEGTGEIEKLTIGAGVSFRQKSYPLAIYRREDSFDVVSEIMDIQWIHPFAFAHNLKAASVEQLNLKIDRGEHKLEANSFKFTGEQTGEFIFDNSHVTCQGSSTEKNPISRMKSDCLEKMEAVVEHMDLPFNILKSIADQLPENVPDEVNLPANDFSLLINKGDFFSYVRIKLIVKAYLRVWGHSQFEDQGKTLAIRLDQVKYGVIPVTTIVMNELSRHLKHPNVRISPPWIRIKLGSAGKNK